MPGMLHEYIILFFKNTTHFSKVFIIVLTYISGISVSDRIGNLLDKEDIARTQPQVARL